MILAKKLKFFHLLYLSKKISERFVLCKIHPEKVFGDVLVRKEAFLDNINMDLKEGKIGTFAKGIVHDFGQKVEVSSCFVFIKNGSTKSDC